MIPECPRWLRMATDGTQIPPDGVRWLQMAQGYHQMTPAPKVAQRWARWLQVALDGTRRCPPTRTPFEDFYLLEFFRTCSSSDHLEVSHRNLYESLPEAFQGTTPGVYSRSLSYEPSHCLPYTSFPQVLPLIFWGYQTRNLTCVYPQESTPGVHPGVYPYA